ncbi:MAG: ElyC/SanA/YdcF family protein [Anaerolineaceae bacterium]|nr:ElyC/SanA/YdcF family protein [Anaerolineaceae bacterium]MDD4042108.1 ElyC/SanA/YdcF family protein [Anaerolineaceae bacterium]MDD4577802.1 ElyC/SanA/YdcF family protein [Anaerolineaceae bacterium]
MKKLLQALVIIMCVAFFVIGILRVTMLLVTKDATYTLETVPAKPVVLVPGAGLNASGGPSAPLKDRLDTAIELYRQGKVEKLLLSGDNTHFTYNEPAAMQVYALAQGIPDEDLVLDYAGRRTYDSCYRAHHIFGLDEVVVVTQAYHLPRALFLCENSDLDAVGVPVEQSDYIRSRYLFWNAREVFATVMAWLDVYVLKPLPVLGEMEPIF